MKLIKNILILLILSMTISNQGISKPAHHNSDGTFSNVEGSPQRSGKSRWSYWTFYQEKKKLKINIPNDHVIDEKLVLKSLEENKNNDYVAWIGHATFLIKLGNNIIITDPIFSKNAGPLFLGSYRYVKPAIPLNKIPKTDALLLTHSHYDHLDTRTLSNFPHKKTKAVVPLKLDKFFSSRGFNNIKELDWYQSTTINDEIKITLVPAVHWSKRTPFNTNETLWGSFLIEHKGKKILFACDTGIGNVYKEIGEKFGPIDILFINIGAYDFRPMFDRSIFHTTPEEALEVGSMVKAKKVIGMHWGTFILSLEDPFEPPIRFKNSAEKYGYQKEDAVLFKIGELKTISEIIK
jgi:N-acyl-phosphatidylethanolamine-hydrolysing phospholipase D